MTPEVFERAIVELRQRSTELLDHACRAQERGDELDAMRLWAETERLADDMLWASRMLAESASAVSGTQPT